jgi:hypothetical protein
MKWTYNGKEFNDEMIPEGAYGFIYAIKIEIDGKQKRYIGQKKFYAERNVPKGKRELEAMTDKRGSKKKKVIKLNYQKYHSSNKVINEAIKNGAEYKKIILKICFSKLKLTYQETRYLFKLDVLENEKYLNDNILGKFYKSKINNNVTEETT